MVDSRASMHMMSKSDFSRHFEHRKSLVRSSVTTTEEATVYVKDYDMLITVRLLEDSPTVSSLGNFAKNTGVLRMEGQQLPTSRAYRKQILCKSQTSPRSDATAACVGRAPTASGDREQGIPDWLHSVTEELVEGESGSSGIAGETIPKYPRPHSSETLEQLWRGTPFIHSFSEGPHVCKRTKITRAPCRRNPESREDRIPRATTFGDVVTADHKVLNEENESPVQKQDSTRYLTRFAANLSSRKQAWSDEHW